MFKWLYKQSVFREVVLIASVFVQLFQGMFMELCYQLVLLIRLIYICRQMSVYFLLAACDHYCVGLF